MPLRFTLDDANRAFDECGANCGPCSIAAVLGLTLDDLRPQMGDFESKHYTNPTLMWDVLKRCGVCFSLTKPPREWPDYGLARVQWEGPWTAPGVPARVAYRHTHWVGARAKNPLNVDIFDINAMNSGGWVGVADWAGHIVPWIIEHCVAKGATGRWHLTHVVEIWA